MPSLGQQSQKRRVDSNSNMHLVSKISPRSPSQADDMDMMDEHIQDGEEDFGELDEFADKAYTTY